jgi:hypothetical protein
LACSSAADATYCSAGSGGAPPRAFLPAFSSASTWRLRFLVSGTFMMAAAVWEGRVWLLGASTVAGPES